MPDLYSINSSQGAVVVGADQSLQRKLTNRGPGSFYYKAESDVDSGDTEVTSGSSVTFDSTQWIVSASTSYIIQENLVGTSVQDSTINDDLVVSDTLSVTGATTTTGGIAAASVTPTQAGTWQPIAATSGTDTACTNGTAYVGSIFLPNNKTLTGIQYLVGSVGGTDKVVASLHNYATGAVLANSATAGATVGTAAQVQQVAFTSTYAAKGPAHYWVALTFNGTTAKFRSVPAHTQAGNGVLGNGVTQTFGTPATFTVPTTFTADKVPVASVY